MVKIRHVIVIVATAALLAACGPTDTSTGVTASPTASTLSTAAATFDPKAIEPLSPVPVAVVPVTVTGSDGKKVTITSTARIVAVNLSGSVAEIVATLGLGKNLVGKDIAATFHGLEDVPVVTQGHDLAAEPILALNPTVLITDASTGPAEVLEQIRAAGIPVVMVPEAWSLADVGPRITAVAAALGVPAAGAALTTRTTAQITQALALSPKSNTRLRVAFLYLRGTAGVYLMAGKGSGADSMIEAIGAQDAGTAIGISKFRPLTSEGLINAAPDVILVMTDGLRSVGGIDGLVKIAGIAQTPAGQNRRVVDMDDGALLSFGPRSGEIVLALAAKVYRTAG